MPFGPLRLNIFWILTPFWGVKFQKITFRKNRHFFYGYFMAPMTLFRHIWMANGCQIQNQRTKLPLGAQKPEKWHMTSSKVIDLGWPRLTSERSQCKCKPWMSPRGTYPCLFHQQKYRRSQVPGVETYGTQISLGMIMDIRLQVKGLSRYGHEIFREDLGKLFKG